MKWMRGNQVCTADGSYLLSETQLAHSGPVLPFHGSMASKMFFIVQCSVPSSPLDINNNTHPMKYLNAILTTKTYIFNLISTTAVFTRNYFSLNLCIPWKCRFCLHTTNSRTELIVKNFSFKQHLLKMVKRFASHWIRRSASGCRKCSSKALPQNLLRSKNHFAIFLKESKLSISLL